MTLDLELQKHANANPYKVALEWEAGSYTYGQLNEKVQKLAEKWHLDGIEAGDRIAIILENTPEFVISYYACMRLGVVSVPINPSLTRREYEVILRDSVPKVVVTSYKVKEVIKDIPALVHAMVITIDDGGLDNYMQHEQPVQLPEANHVEDCTILYTSGTTGMPKGAILTHHNLFSNAKTFAEWMKITADDRALIVAPLSHIAAQTNLLNTTIVSGGYFYLLKRWESSKKTLQVMEEKDITFFFGPPTMYTYMLNEPNVENYQLKLKVAYTGASSLPKSIFERWREVFGFEIVEGYGLTECSPVVSANPIDGQKKIGSVGLPITDVQVKIVNDQFEEVPVGEVGELVVKGPSVMKGYFNREKENQEAFYDGWFRTGDIAKQDEDGYLYIVDRKKDVIIRSGFNVYPREVEEVLYSHPAVLEAAVIGVPDEEKGELVKAVITFKPGFSERIVDDIKKFCKTRLATYKIPTEFEVVDEIPKTNTGKILKHQLRKMYA